MDMNEECIKTAKGKQHAPKTLSIMRMDISSPLVEYIKLAMGLREIVSTLKIRL